MLDILLVLIIAAILGIQQYTVDVQLPVPAPSAPPDPGVPLVLSITRGPSYSLNGTPVPRERLVADLAAVFEDRPEKILFIDGARDVSYQDVFYVYGAVRGAGVTVTAIVPPGTKRAQR